MEYNLGDPHFTVYEGNSTENAKADLQSPGDLQSSPGDAKRITFCQQMNPLSQNHHVHEWFCFLLFFFVQTVKRKENKERRGVEMRKEVLGEKS